MLWFRSEGEWKAQMHESRRYRDNAAECLLAAQDECQPYYRRLHLSMAGSWLSLANQDEAIENHARATTFQDLRFREPVLGQH
jgi:hypothetical protein